MQKTSLVSVQSAASEGTAIDLELNRDANGVILDAVNGDKVIAMTKCVLSPISYALAWGMAVSIFVLLRTFPVTSVSTAAMPAE